MVNIQQRHLFNKKGKGNKKKEAAEEEAAAEEVVAEPEAAEPEPVVEAAPVPTPEPTP